MPVRLKRWLFPFPFLLCGLRVREFPFASDRSGACPRESQRFPDIPKAVARPPSGTEPRPGCLAGGVRWRVRGWPNIRFARQWTARRSRPLIERPAPSHQKVLPADSCSTGSILPPKIKPKPSPGRRGQEAGERARKRARPRWTTAIFLHSDIGVARPTAQFAFIGSLLSIFRMYWDHELRRVVRLSSIRRRSQSARGLAHSKTWRNTRRPSQSRSVLECGSPLPLFPARSRDGKREEVHGEL